MGYHKNLSNKYSATVSLFNTFRYLISYFTLRDQAQSRICRDETGRQGSSIASTVGYNFLPGLDLL